MFIIMLQCQTVSFCNALNSTYIRNVIIDGENGRTIRHAVSCCNFIAISGNAPNEFLVVIHWRTQIYQRFCKFIIIRIICTFAIQQFLCCCTFSICLECKGNSGCINCIIHLQRNFCSLLIRFYENLVRIHSVSTCVRCFFAGNFYSGIYVDISVYIDTKNIIFISCMIPNAYVMRANPVKQFALLAVQLFSFKYQREVIVRISIFIFLLFQSIVFSDCLYRILIRNFIEQRNECVTICNFACTYNFVTAGRNAPAQAL